MFLRPRCRRPDTPSPEAAVVMAAAALAAVMGVATAVADIMAVVFTAAVIAVVVFMVAVLAAPLSAVGISPSAIFTAERRISVHLLATA